MSSVSAYSLYAGNPLGGGSDRCPVKNALNGISIDSDKANLLRRSMLKDDGMFTRAKDKVLGARLPLRAVAGLVRERGYEVQARQVESLANDRNEPGLPPKAQRFLAAMATAKTHTAAWEEVARADARRAPQAQHVR